MRRRPAARRPWDCRRRRQSSITLGAFHGGGSCRGSAHTGSDPAAHSPGARRSTRWQPPAPGERGHPVVKPPFVTRARDVDPVRLPSCPVEHPRILRPDRLPRRAMTAGSHWMTQRRPSGSVPMTSAPRVIAPRRPEPCPGRVAPHQVAYRELELSVMRRVRIGQQTAQPPPPHPPLLLPSRTQPPGTHPGHRGEHHQSPAVLGHRRTTDTRTAGGPPTRGPPVGARPRTAGLLDQLVGSGASDAGASDAGTSAAARRSPRHRCTPSAPAR